MKKILITLVSILIFSPVFSQQIDNAELVRYNGAKWKVKVREFNHAVEDGRLTDCNTYLKWDQLVISHPFLPCGTMVLLTSYNAATVRATVVHHGFNVTDKSIYVSQEVKRLFNHQKPAEVEVVTIQIIGVGGQITPPQDMRVGQEDNTKEFVEKNKGPLLVYEVPIEVPVVKEPEVVQKSDERSKFWTVQVLATTKLNDARKKCKQLKEKGENDTYIVMLKDEMNKKKSALYRVYIGNFDDKKQAEDRLKQSGLKGLTQIYDKEKQILIVNE